MSRLLVALLCALAAASAAGQNAPAQAAGGTTWYVVTYFKYKEGLRDEARQLISEHIWPVEREVGIAIVPFDFETGEWDDVVFEPMPGGPGDLARPEADNPLAARWDAALARREGGPEKARALLKRFDGMVLMRRTEIAARRF